MNIKKYGNIICAETIGQQELSYMKSSWEREPFLKVQWTECLFLPQIHMLKC